MKAPWDEDAAFRFTILMGLRKSFGFVRGLRRQLSEHEQQSIAREIANHIKLSNWQVRRGESEIPPAPSASDKPQ